MVDIQTIFRTAKLPKPMLPKTDGEDSPFTCGCGLSFSSRVSLQIHRQEYSKISTHVRPILSFSEVPVPVILVRPNPSAMLRDTLPYSCEACQKSFSTQQGLNQHMGKIHASSRKQHKCPLCSKKFKDKYAVKFHLQQVHENHNRVQCHLCHLYFYNKSVFQKHTKTCPERLKLRDAYVM